MFLNGVEMLERNQNKLDADTKDILEVIQRWK